MTSFELLHRCLAPFLPALRTIVRQRLLEIAHQCPHRTAILDVGGRRSRYTIGVPASITITDLPRESDLQRRLDLGLTDGMIRDVQRKRSNVKKVLLDDMTRSILPDNTFDCVVAVEVLEHVEEDSRFVQEVRRVLKPGGVFLMTTPNGDFIPNTWSAHIRHYTRGQLHRLLSGWFHNVQVEYAVRHSRWHAWGKKSWSLKRPATTALSMIGNVVNHLESRNKAVKEQALGTVHLLATATLKVEHHNVDDDG